MIKPIDSTYKPFIHTKPILEHPEDKNKGFCSTQKYFLKNDIFTKENINANRQTKNN